MLPVKEISVVAVAMAAGTALAYVRLVSLAEADGALQHQQALSRQIDERAERVAAEYVQQMAERLSQ